MANGFIPSGISPAALAELQALFEGNEEAQRAVQAAVNVGGEFFGGGQLGRVDDQLSADQASGLVAARGLLGQLGRSGEGQRAVDALFSLQGQAGATDPVLQEILNRRRAGLEGLTGAELTAQREAGAEEINRNLQTALRAAGAQNVARGISGGASAAALPGIAREALQARRGLERDIFLENVAERNRRLDAFQQLAQGIDANRFNRQQAATGLLNQALLARQGFEAENQRQNIQGFNQALQGIRDDLLGRQQFNIGQLAAERSGQLGLISSFPQIPITAQGREESLAFGREALQAAKGIPGFDPGSIFASLGLGG